MSARSSHLALLAGACVVLVALGLTLAGVSSAPASRPGVAGVDTAAVCAARPGSTVRVAVELDDQDTRSALVHLPAHRTGPVPLVLALHGAYGSGAFMERYSALSRLADRSGFAVVYPDAVGNFWKISARAGAGDVQFLDVLLDRLLAGGCFDGQRVSAVGVSNGAGMAARFACAGDDRLAGLVAVAGGYGTLPGCEAHRPLAVMEIHGTADAVVPYRGTPGQPRGDVMGWLRQWVELDGCHPTPRSRYERRDVLRLDWSGCRDGTGVAHLRLIGGTHAWPGADPPDPGPRLGISATQEAWSFLRGRRISPPAS